MLRSSLAVLLALITLPSYASSDVRKDPDYLAPFAGHSWQFQSAVKSPTITFSDIKKADDSGFYFIDGTNAETGSTWTLSYSSSGYQLYGNRTSGDTGTLFDNFEVNLSNVAGSSAEGHFYTSLYPEDYQSHGNPETNSEQFPTTATRLTGDNTDSCRTEYSPESQILDVPCIYMTNDDMSNYHVRLQQISDAPMEFRVIEIQ